MNHDRRILRIGGVNPDGAHWRISHDAAVEAIEAGRWSFYVNARGHDETIIVALSRYGSKYLKGADDSLHPEGLLALPECG
jgi:hypothetical protein